MMSWSQRMAGAQRCIMPVANSADSANRLDVGVTGTIGTIGTGLSIWEPHPAGRQSALLALSARGLVTLPPCPADVAERAAIIAEGDHCDRTTADTRALAEQGLPSWPALANAHRERILGELARLPPASSDHGHRLIRLTRAFLETEHWRTAVALGWELVEVFGIHAHTPLARPDGRGLVPLLALSAHPGARLEAIEPAGAVFRTKSGARQSYTLGMPHMATAVLWWECAAIMGNPGNEPDGDDA